MLFCLQMLRSRVDPWPLGTSSQHRSLSREESQGEHHVWPKHRTEEHQRLPNSARAEAEAGALLQDSSGKNAPLLCRPRNGEFGTRRDEVPK